MNFNVIYELRDRLEAAAVAGVSLLGEDFRLKRAVEQMEPLSKASPVFAKIYQMGCKLTGEDCGDKAGVLLDMLALVDAVLCTQGSLLKEGQWEPMGNLSGGSYTCTNIPYSRMAPLLEAFGGTGSGRYALIRDIHEEQPELFEDYRIKSLMVKALGDSYGELADMVAKWLQMEGREIIPLLKQGFDPEGKGDMVRRLEVIEAVGGKEENGFYLEVLETAGKEVKECAIGALRHDMGNEALLLDLVKSEKGKLKTAAYQSLAFMEGDKAAQYWKKQMEKAPEKWAGYLGNSSASWTSDLIADHVNRWLDTYGKPGVLWKDLKREEQLGLQTLWNCAQGKHSPKICSCYERVYRIIPEYTVRVLENSLKSAPDPALCQVAEEMYRAHGDQFLFSVFWGDLMTREPEQVFERFCGYLKPEGAGGLIKKIAGREPDPTGIFQAFAHMKYEEKTGSYMAYKTPVTGWHTGCGETGRALEQGLDLRWYDLLLNSKRRFGFGKKAYNYYGGHSDGYDAMLEGIFRPDVEEVKDAYGKYFYLSARNRGTEAADIRMLKRCGWTDYKGLLAQVGKRDGTQIVYKVRGVLEELPLGNEEMAQELNTLVEGLGKRAINGIGILERWVKELKDGVSVGELKQYYR